MIREGSLEEISDGRLYGSRDLVKVDTDGCKGCSACCRGMGTSLVLDPLDVHQLRCGLGRDFMSLMEDAIELNMVDGMILPNIRMQGEEEACCFLNEEGRCRIHEIRPGFCRLFPLGRYYGGDGFAYILQIHECPKAGRKKVRVNQWIGQDNMKEYEKFCLQWHNMQKRVQVLMARIPEEAQRSIITYVLKVFYLQPYDAKSDFYQQFYVRVAGIDSVLRDLEQAAGR